VPSHTAEQSYSSASAHSRLTPLLSLPSLRRYNKLSHLFEITLQRGCVIEECEDSNELPKQQFNFVPLDRIEVCGHAWRLMARISG
jgi:hypothetical protein